MLGVVCVGECSSKGGNHSLISQDITNVVLAFGEIDWNFGSRLVCAIDVCMISCTKHTQHTLLLPRQCIYCCFIVIVFIEKYQICEYNKHEMILL